MPRNLDMSLVRTFVTVAIHGSMTAAGNALHLTQGAVSQQIKRLEDVVGSELFKRNRRGLRLTPSGERLLGKARRLLNLNDEIWAEVTVNAVEGTVRLGAPYDLVGTHLASVLKAYADAYPIVEISLVCGASPELAEMLEQGQIDLAVVEEPVGSSSGECLAMEPLVWVGANGGRAHLKRPLPISMVAETCAFRPAVLAALHGQDKAWRTVFENGNIEATMATVRMDLAITAWLASTVPPDLKILTPDAGLPRLPPFSINLHLPGHSASAATMELARHIRDVMQRHRTMEQVSA
jgi:DNA-binding transcriptional LysR family regulator